MNTDEVFYHLQILAENIAEGLCAIDSKGIVRVWSTSAEQVYQVASEAIIGKKLTDFFPMALLDEVRRTKVAKKNISHMPRNGSHVMISAMPLIVNGRFIGAISTERDYAEVIALYDELEDARAKVSFLENEMKRTSGSFASVIGNSPEFLKKIEIARQIAPVNSNVMITGESGTGKEAFARGIHELSGRDGLFIPINCSAIPSELFESEFFGYAPGSFTGASRKGKAGFFEIANGGTLFLDEIGDMPYPAQAKLLRVLQDGEVVRVGETKRLTVDVRVISATNRDLKKMMHDKTFRDDLFYRLNVVEIKLPSLVERKLDIPPLVEHFITSYSCKHYLPPKYVSPDAMKVLCAYNWPGNVRELMNVVENMVVTSQDGMISVDSIPEYVLADQITAASNSLNSYPMDLHAAVRMLEIDRIQKALQQSGGNKSRAAQLLNIPRVSLYNKLKEHKL